MAAPHGFTELRIYIPNELATRIDAIAMINNLSDRAKFCNPILEKAVAEEIHKATVLLRCARINPLLHASEIEASE